MLLLLLACTPVPEPNDSGQDDPVPFGDPALAGKLDAGLTQAFGDLASPGAAVAVRVPGIDGTYRWAAGFADAGAERPMTIEDRFRVASITKTFVAATALHLVDTGTLELSDPVGAWVSGYPEWSDITLEHLLSHSSGIPDNSSWTISAALSGRSMTADDMLESVSEDGLEFEAGSDFLYSNANYQLASLVIEGSTGQDWRDIVRNTVLEDLPDTNPPGDGVGLDATTVGNVVLEDGQVLPFASAHPSTMGAAGEMVSSLDDLLDWMVALADDPVFGDMAVDQGHEYGLGLQFRQTTDGTWLVGHRGDHIGHTTLLWMDPESGVVVVSMVTTNTLGSDDDDTLQRTVWEALDMPW